MTSSVSRKPARAAARKADLSKLKVKQLKEKSQLEAKIAEHKAQLEAELAIQEAEHEAGSREIQALLLKEGLDDYLICLIVWKIDDNPVGGDKIKAETPQVKEDAPLNAIEDSKQKVTEWLKTVRPEGKLVKGRRMTVVSIYLAKKELWISQSLFFQSQQW